MVNRIRTTTPELARDRRVSRTESRVLEALHRRDRATNRPRSWLDLSADRGWLEAEVGTRYLRQLLDRMAGKGSLFQLGGGRYAVARAGTVDESQALPFTIALDITMGKRPYYLAFVSALSDHSLIDEGVDPIVAVRGRTVAGNDVITVQGRALHVVRVTSERKWIGLERIRVEGRSGYWRSDLERTLLDAVDRPDLGAGGELVARAWERAAREKRIDESRLADHATAIGGLTALRAAFYCDQLQLTSVADQIVQAVGRTRSSKARLDPTGEFGTGAWPRDRHTGLQINFPERRLRGWLSYGK